MTPPAERGVGEVAEAVGISPDTLRYYERRGVLPEPSRDVGGRRIYSEGHIHLIEVLLHLRDTGMPLARIAEFTHLVSIDPQGVPERLALLVEHRELVNRQREQVERSLEVINGKIADYEQRLDVHDDPREEPR